MSLSLSLSLSLFLFLYPPSALPQPHTLTAPVPVVARRGARVVVPLVVAVDGVSAAAVAIIAVPWRPTIGSLCNEGKLGDHGQESGRNHHVYTLEHSVELTVVDWIVVRACVSELRRWTSSEEAAA